MLNRNIDLKRQNNDYCIIHSVLQKVHFAFISPPYNRERNDLQFGRKI